jgi:hypothetical protein
MKSAVTELLSYVTHSHEVPLKDESVRPMDCLQCHGSYAQLAELTRDLKGPEGSPLGRNPHDSHWGPLSCGICHRMHKTSVDFCSECHGFPVSGPAWSRSRLGNSVYYHF